MDKFDETQDWQPEKTDNEIDPALIEAVTASSSATLVIAQLIVEAQAMMHNYRWN